MSSNWFKVAAKSEPDIEDKETHLTGKNLLLKLLNQLVSKSNVQNWGHYALKQLQL